MDHPTTNKGARALREATTPPPLPDGTTTQAQLAKDLGVTRQAVEQWASGATVPRAEHLARIEDLLGIPMRAWTESEDA